MTPHLESLFARLNVQIDDMQRQRIALDEAKGLRATGRAVWRFWRAFVRFERIHTEIKLEVGRLEGIERS